MTPGRPDAAASYELRISGHLDRHWSAWFDGFIVTHEDDGTTALRGVVRDQSELHGVLDKIRNLGTTLISVMPLRTTDAAASGPAGNQQPPGHSGVGPDAIRSRSSKEAQASPHPNGAQAENDLLLDPP